MVFLKPVAVGVIFCGRENGITGQVHAGVKSTLNIFLSVEQWHVKIASFSKALLECVNFFTQLPPNFNTLSFSIVRNC